MTKPRRFAVDPRRVVHETIDGETILIHLQSGTYYSLSGCGADIWGLLTHGWPYDDVVREMQRRHAESPAVIAAALRALVRDLSREDLIEVAQSNGHGAPAPVTDAPAGQRFSPPSLEKFTDLQYFLLLDPVHEVENKGWPHEHPAGADAR